MSVLRIQLFGGLNLTWDEQPLPPIPSAAARSLLAYLVTFQDRPHTRDLLAGTCWPDLSDKRARRRLRQALWQVRHALADLASSVPLILTDAHTVQFNPAASTWLDIQEFEQLGESVRQRSLTDAETLDRLARAVALYRGDFLAGTYDDWALIPREQLRGQYLDMLSRLVTSLKAQGGYEEALGYARRLAAEAPLREEAHREVMQLYHLLGRPAEALKQYELCWATLAEELGVEPAPATTILAQEIAAQAEMQSPPHLPVRLPPLLDDGAAVLPLVGRQAERATLLTLVEEALAGHGGLVLVEGEAGVGKTRLLQEVAQGAAWRGVQVAWGRGLEFAPASPYGVLTEALEAVLSPLRAGQLADLVPGVWLQAISRLLPDLTTWLPRDSLPPHVPLGPARDRARLLDALTRTIRSLGQITPHLLIFEDLHWADESTLAALTYMVRRLDESRVLIAGSYRSGEARHRSAVWAALQDLDRAVLRKRLVLERLDAAATGELVRRGLGLTAEAPRFEARLYAETEGNPLFVLETLRALRDEGILARDASGAWRTPWDETTVDYAELPLPASVREVIARRLARLDPSTRAVLDVAAVLGSDFDFAILAQAGHLDRKTALVTVGDLVRRRFLVEGPEVYAFSHDQVRRVVYRALNDGERRRLHVQAGEALEALHPERVEALAQHFDRGGVREKALAYTLRAGERAEDIYDYRAALNHYERALSLVGDDPAARWDVLGQQEQVLGILTCLEAQVSVLEEMLALAQALDDPVRQARTRYRQGWCEVLAGEPARALALLDEAMRLARAVGKRDLLGTCLIAAARAWWRIGDVAHCQTAIEEARSLFQEIDDRQGELHVLNMLGNLHLGLTGYYARALACFQENRRVAHELGNPYAEASAHGNIGIAYSLLGCYAHSQELLAEAAQVMDRVGDRHWQGIIRRWQAANYRGLGELAQAQIAAEEALTICRETSNRNFEIALLELLGQIALDQQEPERARAYFQQAIKVAQANQQAMDAVIIQAHLALTSLYVGCPEEALQISDQAIAALETSGAQLGRTRFAYLERGRIVAAVQGATAAWPCLERAHQIVQDMAADIGDPDLRRSFLENVPENQAIVTAYRTGRLLTPPRRQIVRLPRAYAPTGRPLRDDEYVEVTWTVAAPEDEEISGKAARRQDQIRRLLAQAAEQAAAPTVDDLATALGVSRATIKRDLAALRRAGYEVQTRGSRSR